MREGDGKMAGKAGKWRGKCRVCGEGKNVMSLWGRWKRGRSEMRVVRQWIYGEGGKMRNTGK